MGDMADFSIGSLIDRDGNPSKGDRAFWSKKKRVNTISNITCKYCKKTGLYWDTVDGKYRLHDKGSVHTCY